MKGPLRVESCPSSGPCRPAGLGGLLPDSYPTTNLQKRTLIRSPRARARRASRGLWQWIPSRGSRGGSGANRAPPNIRVTTCKVAVRRAEPSGSSGPILPHLGRQPFGSRFDTVRTVTGSHGSRPDRRRWRAVPIGLSRSTDRQPVDLAWEAAVADRLQPSWDRVATLRVVTRMLGLPLVDLARRVAGDACEGGLADVGAGEQGGELGV
jgi:hypothetical protein